MIGDLAVPKFFHIKSGFIECFSVLSWASISDEFLSSFNNSDFEELYDGKSSSSGCVKKTARQKRRRLKRKEEYEMVYGILDEDEEMTVRYITQG